MRTRFKFRRIGLESNEKCWYIKKSLKKDVPLKKRAILDLENFKKDMKLISFFRKQLYRFLFPREQVKLINVFRVKRKLKECDQELIEV